MIVQGVLAALSPICILLVFMGVCVGIVFGAIPGLSATMAIVLFLPMSFALEPINAISLLIALYVGGISGGLISATLINIPGTPASLSTLFDGHPMAERGEAGRALGIGILYSFIGTIISCLALIFISPYLAAITLRFTPVEYFAVTIFSITIIASLSGKSLIKGLLSGMIGLSITLIGMSSMDGYVRFTFGNYQLNNGVNIVPMLIGFYAITEIFNAGFNRDTLSLKFEKRKFELKGYGITLKEFGGQTVNMIRSAVIGIIVGILPGIGGGTAGLIAYSAAKNASKYPEKFGTGIIDGIIASETSNNATIGGALIPLLTMGIPGSTATAVLLSGLMIHGISPGPMIFVKNGAVMYGIFTSLMIASFFMLLVERGFLRYFVKLLDIPKHILLPCVVVVCTVGAYAANGRIFDVWCVLFFGILGMVMKYFKLPYAPMVISFTLGAMAESYLRRALQINGFNLTCFFTRPISLVFIIAAVISMGMSIRKHMTAVLSGAEEVGEEED